MTEKVFYDDLDEAFDDIDEIYFEDLFDNSYANQKYVLVGQIERWDGSGEGYSPHIFNSIKEAITGAVDGWGICYLKIFEENYGRLYVTVRHHDGTNYLEIREITQAGMELYYNTDDIGKVVHRKGATRNVKFNKKYY